MLHRLKVFAIAIAALGFVTSEAIADEALLDGVRPFMCDGEAIVFFETDNGWVISTSPTAEVKSTDNGWRFEDTLSGGVWYLREESRNSWVVDGVSEDGHFTADCIDLADSVSQVVTIIKPRLDEGILDIEEALTSVRRQLSEVLSKNSELQEDNAELIKNAQRITALLEAEKTKYSALRLAGVKKLEAEKAKYSALRLAGVKKLEAEKAKYSALRLAGVKNLSSASFVLRDLVGMGPSERNTTINSSNLLQALNGSGMLPQCVKLLRDKAKLNEKCEETIIDFLLFEGWQ